MGNAILSYAIIVTGKKSIIYERITIFTIFHNKFYLHINIFGNKSTVYNNITDISKVFINNYLRYKFSSESILNVGKGHKEDAIPNINFNIGHAGIFISIQGKSNKII